jgi:hypothetical protein
MNSNPRSRRTHSSEFKAQVMAEGRKPGASIAAVALRHGLNPNLVHKWFAGQGLKRTGLTAPSAMASAPGLQFIPVGVTTANGPNPALALAASDDWQLELVMGALSVKLSCPRAAAAGFAPVLRSLADAMERA